MKFYLADDIHLEFGPVILPGDPEGILLLAGDITVAWRLGESKTDSGSHRTQKNTVKFFNEECRKYKKVFYVMGNHEHYYGDFLRTAGVMRHYLRGTNVTVLDNESADLGNDIALFGGTMWTDMQKSDWFSMQYAKLNMADFDLIKVLNKGNFDEYVTFSPAYSVKEHENFLHMLTNFLERNREKKVIVMTHHMPTEKFNEKYIGNRLNPAYGSDLSNMILNNTNIKVWGHGHVHDPADYMVGDCRVLCKPRGYYGYEINKVEFEPILFEV